jgi:hypothetical protein
MDRRRFLKVSAATAAAISAAHWIALTKPPATVLFDSRYSDARLFGRASEQQGAMAMPVERNVVAQWFAVVAPRAVFRGARIAGLTVHSDLELLQACGAEVGLALRREAFHDSRARSTLNHRIATGADAQGIQPLHQADMPWPIAMAGWHMGSEESTPVGSLGTWFGQSPYAVDDHPGTLVSWLLA